MGAGSAGVAGKGVTIASIMPSRTKVATSIAATAIGADATAGKLQDTESVPSAHQTENRILPPA